MTTTFFLLLLLLATTTTSTPYLSPTTFPQDFHSMLQSFKIFIYPQPSPPPSNFSDPSSLFHNSLLHSHRFLTADPSAADLFFLPFSPETATSTRSLARAVRALRTTYPFWNRSLGADHFFLSPAGIDYSSDRNALELKKNSIQISPFPVVSGLFIPHKDITLPPPAVIKIPSFSSPIRKFSILGENGTLIENYFDLVNGEEKFRRFCLFDYNGGDVTWLPEAMAVGCVPVVIVDRPIQDLPFMDVLRWSDLAIVAAAGGGDGAAGRLKRLLDGVSEEKFATMRENCVAASKHLVWTTTKTDEIESEPLDAFHTVMYQLWRRRHVVRYSRREFV